jgi:bifunctional non-homologous end joining protein LigD
MPVLLKELAGLGIESGWLDGEVVVLRDDGVPDFNALQNAFDRRTGAGIVYFLFDVPFFEGYDLRQATLRDRRRFLEAFFQERTTEHVRISVTFDADPRSILDSACRMGLEGVIAKRANAPYVSRRTDDWLKLKCKKRQEFVIAGYVDRTGTTRQVGSLVLGVYQSGELVPAGSAQGLIRNRQLHSRPSWRNSSRKNHRLLVAYPNGDAGRSASRGRSDG